MQIEQCQQYQDCFAAIQELVAKRLGTAQRITFTFSYYVEDFKFDIRNIITNTTTSAQYSQLHTKRSLCVIHYLQC